MLTLYNKKRNFKNTPEPKGNKQSGAATHRFVVQRHAASRLHYDFRLEIDGVLKSWAVPKGPSLNPSEKRLAVQVEDHPISYIDFSGTIPEGNYGAGTVEVWDKGIFTPVDEKGNDLTDKQAAAWMKKGEFKFRLKGKKLNGEFVLVQLKKDPKNWLLIKHKDAFAVSKPYNPDKVAKPAAKSSVDTKKSSKPKKVAAAIPAPVKTKQEKLAHFHKPMLATPSADPFDDKDWVFEIKWDGYRAISDRAGKELKLYSRNGLSFAGKYPGVAAALSRLKHNMILDGEIVVLDEHGKPSFQLLQQYGDHPEYPIIYYVFDLLFLNGKDIRHLPLIERKALLKKALPKTKNSIVRFCEHVKANGKDFFRNAIKMDLEGMIAKRADSEYQEGVRNNDWLKIKNHNTREAIIAGFTAPRGGRQHFGALILAEQRGRQLTYIGHTGTGFTEKTLRDLWDQLQPDIIATSPFKEKIKVNMPVTWVKPRLVAQVKFTEKTADGMLRHPVYLGLREDKAAADVKQSNETPQKKRAMKKPAAIQSANEKTVKVNSRTLQLTNLHKVYWPKDKITKGALIEYYDKIAPVLLPYLKNRPLSLKRNPNGIDEQAFYQKDAGANFPEWIKTAPFLAASTGKTVDYTICNDKATLLYLANLGCIEMNPWNSTVKSPDKPSYMIMDIDPSEKNNFDQVIETVQVICALFEKAGATYYCKTSGATGLHVFVPLNAKYTYEQARSFGEIIATLTQEQLPGFTSLERSLKKRGNKIYIDYLQNSRGQTIASAYSVRPVAGAQVSTPLLLKEIKKGLHPSQFTIFNIEKRVKELGDVFYMALKKGNNIHSCLKKLGY
ncbi:MAG: DNA ligase D [Chitinophagaceae bacterium]